MTWDPTSAPDVDSLLVQGEQGARHRRLLQDANAMLMASPAPALLESVQTIHRILLAADPKAFRRSVGWLGRLLGRDIVLHAESESLRHELGVHVVQAHGQLDALAESDLQLQGCGNELHAAINDLDQQSTLVAGLVVAGASNEHPRQLQHLATLAASVRITASHLELTLLNHRDLIQRVEQMLPRVEMLLDQQRMLRAGLSEHAAFAAATHSLEAVQDLEHVNVATATSR